MSTEAPTEEHAGSTLGAETATSVTASAYARLGDVAANVWCYISAANGELEIIGAACG